MTYSGDLDESAALSRLRSRLFTVNFGLGEIWLVFNDFELSFGGRVFITTEGETTDIEVGDQPQDQLGIASLLLPALGSKCNAIDIVDGELSMSLEGWGHIVLPNEELPYEKYQLTLQDGTFYILDLNGDVQRFGA